MTIALYVCNTASMGRHFDVIIIGGGSVGCATAYALARYDLRTLLLERCPDVCMGTSGKTSAVVHAGFNNRPGSLMAELCVKGNKLFEDVCRELDVPYKKTGKLVVALDEGDLPAIEKTLMDGERNGCVGLSMVGAAELSEMEPNVMGIAALLSSNTAIIDPFAYVIHLAEAALLGGAEFRLGSEVTAIEREPGRFRVVAGENSYTCDVIVNSAGMYSDAVAALAGDASYRIYPNRGEYFILDKQAAQITGRPIYPVPREGLGGLGVHLTPTIDGNLLIGPTSQYVDGREDYANTPGKMESLFKEARQLIPSLSMDMAIGAFTGMRAKIVPPGSANFGDFIIEESKIVPGLINLVGIESPGLTASMPIALLVCEMLRARHGLSEKSGRPAGYKRAPVFRDLDTDAQNELISQNPDYGEIICRCENVTKAEVINALNNPLGVRTLIGIKNRVRTMMGRCQGGYCFTHLADILINEFGVDPKDVTYRSFGDTPFYGGNK